MKKILVCGGRDYTDTMKITATIANLTKEYGKCVIIHGAARGADSLAGGIARKFGWWVWPCDADWDKYGTAAGPIRNRMMLDLAKPDLVVAFKGGKGTADMVAYAKSQGVETIIISPT